MIKQSIKDALLNLENGNISDFKAWVKRASKLDILDAIELYASIYGGRHRLINHMRRTLTDTL